MKVVTWLQKVLGAKEADKAKRERIDAMKTFRGEFTALANDMSTTERLNLAGREVSGERSS